MNACIRGLSLATAVALGIALAGCGGSDSPSTTTETCTSFTYSDWGACQSNGTQTRTVTASSPSACTGGSPVLSQSCTYTRAVTFNDVVNSCTGCHGLTSNTTAFKAGGYAETGKTSSYWLSEVNSMTSFGATLAAGTTAQGYADYLAGVP